MTHSESSDKTTLDVFKNRTLSCLQQKNEPSRTYPLEAEDLLTVSRCPICQSEQLVLLTQVSLESGLNFFNTSACTMCHFTFRSLSPALRWFQKCWKMIATETPAVFNPEAESIRIKRYRDYAQLLKSYVPQGRMLDIGAAFGSGTQVFKDQGYQVEALETEDNKERYIRQVLQIPVHTSPVEEFLEGSQGPYDLIVFVHCLEHLDHPEQVMAKLPKLMHQDTVLYVEVPLMQEFVSWSDALFLTHKSNFSEKNLEELARKVGFKILHRTYFRHTDAEGTDIGLVLKMDPEPSIEACVGVDVEISEVQQLYRQGLEVPSALSAEQTLCYQVPCIQHFFYTLRLNEWKVTQALNAPGLRFRPN